MILTYTNNGIFFLKDAPQTDTLRFMAEGWHRRDDGTFWTNSPYAAALHLPHADAATEAYFKPLLQRLRHSRAETSDFPCVETGDPETALDATQRAGVEWAVNTPNALIADPMGSGKTAMALVAANTLGAETILVVCPAIVKQNWMREFGRFYIHGTKDVEIVNGSRHKITKKRIIINYDLIHKPTILQQLLDESFDLIILDEVHYLKNIKSKRTLETLSMGGVANLAKRRIALSGTPLTARPREVYPVMVSFAPDALTPFENYFDYTRHFCNGRKTRFGWDDSGASNLQELNFRLRTSIMLRRPPELFRKSAPTIVYQPVDIRNHREYLDVENSLLSTPEYSRVIEELAPGALKKKQKNDKNLGEAATLRIRLAELKVPPVVDFIKETLEQDEKIVVFCHHKIMVEGIIDIIGASKCVRITGDTHQTARQEAIELFCSDEKVRVLVGNIQAAGTGLDGLQKAANICLFAETTWIPGEIDQAIARLDRRGQKKQVYAYFLPVKGSIDETISKSINIKRKTIEEVLK